MLWHRWSSEKPWALWPSYRLNINTIKQGHRNLTKFAHNMRLNLRIGTFDLLYLEMFSTESTMSITAASFVRGIKPHKVFEVLGIRSLECSIGAVIFHLKSSSSFIFLKDAYGHKKKCSIWIPLTNNSFPAPGLNYIYIQHDLYLMVGNISWVINRIYSKFGFLSFVHDWKRHSFTLKRSIET